MTDNLNLEDFFAVLNIQKHCKNRDKIVNKNGKELISFCKNQGLLIGNGRIVHDRHLGNYTATESSCLDYVLLSPGLLSKVLYFEVNNFDSLLSDMHQGIDLTLKFACFKNIQKSQPKKKPV